MPHRLPDEHINEYRADGIVHFFGVLFAIFAGLYFLFFINNDSHALHPWAYLTYSLGLLASFSCSAAYNMNKTNAHRAVLRKFDKAAIYLMIAGTYTPLSILGIGGSWGILLAAIAWAIALFGIIGTVFYAQRFEGISLYVYLFQGWLIIGALKPMFDTMTGFAFSMILIGGLVYTTGVIFYRNEEWKYNRAIWHVFVLTAAIIHFLAVVDIVEAAQ